MIKTQKEFVLSSLQKKVSFPPLGLCGLLQTNIGAKIRSAQGQERGHHAPTRNEEPHALPSAPCFRPPGLIARKNYPRLSVGFLLSPSRIKLAHCSHLTSVGATVKWGKGGAEPDACRQASSPLPNRTTCRACTRASALLPPPPTAQLTRGATLAFLSFPTTPTPRVPAVARAGAAGCSVTSYLCPRTLGLARCAGGAGDAARAAS